MALLRKNAIVAVVLALTACTDLAPGSDTADGGQVASDGGDTGEDATITGCTPTVSNLDYDVLAHGGALRVTGTCFANTMTVRIASIAVPFTSPVAGEIAIAALPDTIPVGTTSLVIESTDGTSAPEPITVVHLTIDEVDAKTGPGANDNSQFIEIGTGLTGVRDLSGYTVVVVNGGSDTTYTPVPMAVLGNTGANGTYLFGTSSIASRQATLSNGYLAPTTNAHLIVIVQTTLVVAPSLAVTSIPGVVIDAVVFSKSDLADDTGLLTFAFPTASERVQWSETAGGASANSNSVRRCGTTRRSGTSFALGAPSPGLANTCP